MPHKKPRWSFKFDENINYECKGPRRTNGSARKRITYLVVGCVRSPGWEFHTERIFSLLSKLEYLETLCLCHCNSFRFTDTISKFPNLKSLTVACLTTNGSTIGSLDFLMKIRSSNLEYVNMGSYTIASEMDLATLLFDIFPSFPKLEKFHVFWNNVKSLKSISERIDRNKNNESRIAAKSRLRRLDLGGYLEKVRCDALGKEEAEALKTILCAFRALNDVIGLFGLPSSRTNHEELPRSISYLMELNFQGRILVENRTAAEDTTTVPSIHSPIPLSLWPTVLARCWKQEPVYQHTVSEEDFLIEEDIVEDDIEKNYQLRKFKNPDGIYYLIQTLWVLQEGTKRNDCRRSK